MHNRLPLSAALILVVTPAAHAQLLDDSARGVFTDPLPPIIVPPENPITEPKRVLGKILFWDEQLSSDNTRACGSCHINEVAGTEPDPVPHPGADGVFGTDDDTFSSRGVIRARHDGTYAPDTLFNLDPQATPRTAPPTVFAAYFGELFWDGRASGEFVDPVSGDVVIPLNGALESQSVNPLFNESEMAHEDREWQDVIAELETAVPLALADDLPPDTAGVLSSSPGYPELFEDAFGDPEITAPRIAMAIATYQRTLIPDQTPWDRHIAGEPGAMTPNQEIGWSLFQGRACVICHTPPFFTDSNYQSIGLRPDSEDPGRFGVSGVKSDVGLFKSSTLRNVGLKKNFFHTGGPETFEEILDVYAAETDFVINPNRSLFLPVIIPPHEAGPIEDFIMNALIDPRVASGTSPFDRPALYHEWNGDRWAGGNPAVLQGGRPGSDGLTPRVIALAPPNVGNAAFKIGLADGLAGAAAALAISADAPIDGVVAPDRLEGPYVLDADNTGRGYTTHLMPIPARPALEGDVLYAQWRVDDAAAQDGVALSPPIRVEYFCNGACPSTCPADLAEPFDVLDLADVQGFISAFMNGEPLADLAEPTGVFDLADVQAFIDSFNAGCP